MKTYRIVSRDNEIICSFCHKPQDKVAKMVSDPTRKVFICDQCIKVCHELVGEKSGPAN